jgi:hypothetical protein
MKIGIMAGAAAAAWLVAASVANATVVTIPDPGGAGFEFLGNGDASVVYDGVEFSTSAALSNGNFFNVGPGFSGSPAVLSSQQQSVGVANILISLPQTADDFSVNFGTFGGSLVTFTLSNGDTFTEQPGGSAYAVPSVFSVEGLGPFTSVLITSPDGVLNINNIVFGVPEPGTWAMMLVGFGAMGASLRLGRRKTKEISLTA